MGPPSFDLVLFARLLLGSIFVMSASLKLKDMNTLLQAVADYRLLPQWSVAPAGFTLASLELFLGLSLLIGFYLGISFLMISILLAIFTGAVSLKLVKGKPVQNCGCFGELLSDELHWTIVARNLAFLMLAASLVWRIGFSTMINPIPITPTLGPTILLAVAGILVIFLSSYIFRFLNPLSFVPGRQTISSTARKS